MYGEEQLFGSQKTKLECMTTSDSGGKCLGTFSQEMIKRALPKKVLEKLEEATFMAPVESAGIEDLTVKVFRVLTDEESRLVTEGMRQSGSESDIMASLGGDSITRRNLLTLQPGAWLSDEVIHYYFSLLRERDKKKCEQTGGRRR
jgi:Ulp1 family protease